MGGDRERIAQLEREVAELRKYRRFVEVAFDSVWVLDVDGRVRYVSPVFGTSGAQTFDAPIGEANALDLIHPEDVESARAALRRVAAGAQGESALLRLRHKGTDGGWVESDAFVQNCLEDPEVRGIVVTGRAAGTRNPLHVALLDSERRFRALFEAASVAVTLRDVARQRFIDCNDAALRLYGAKTREELLASTPDTLAPPVQPDGVASAAFLKNAVATAMRDGAFRGEWMARRLTGELFPATVRITRIDLEDGPIFQTLIEDITDAKRNEAMLARAKEEAERASRMKSSFLAAMTHELRTPLTGVVGMVDLLMTTPLDERQRRYAETARSSARMLMSVIDDILDFSKIEAGKLDLAAAPFSVRDVIDEVGNVLALAAEQKSIELVCSTDGVDGRFVGDGDRLRQIVMNLAHNAIKFTSRGEVFVRAYAVNEDERGLTLRVDVVDTGIGIAREDLPRVFLPFTQLATERGRLGTGLGLTICRELVERMGGTMGVESTQGVGSTFFFSFRLARAGDAPIADARPPARCRVLVIAGSSRAREVLVHHLGRLGCGVDTVSDPAMIQQRLATMPEDRIIVIVDDAQRGIDGRVLAARIRDDGSPDRTRVLFVESVAHPLDERERKWLSIDHCCSKPVWSQEIEAAIRVVTRDARAVASTPKVAVARRAERVLLVDDDAITSDVACGLLAAAGFDDVTVARDGALAVDAFARETFDVVLMDFRLPRIDGLEATRRMRAMERRQGVRRTPIVALTASVTTDEVDACRSAGMDDYVAKPVDARRLIDAIERHLADASSPCGLAHGLERVRGDHVLFEKLVRQFIDVAPHARTSMRDALTRHDRDALQYAAHRFRGQAATFDAHALVATLGALEDQARADDWPNAEISVATADRELARVLDALADYLSRARSKLK